MYMYFEYRKFDSIYWSPWAYSVKIYFWQLWGGCLLDRTCIRKGALILIISFLKKTYECEKALKKRTTKKVQFV